MLKAYQYRLYPNTAQSEMFSQHFGVSRFVYNWALALNRRYYSIFGKGLSKRKLELQIIKKKSRNKFSWLKEVNSQTIVSAIWHLHAGYQNFFSGRSRFPRFKSKRSNWQSFQCPQHVQIDQNNNLINLPKIKSIKGVIHRHFDGEIKTCTIKRNPRGHYYISVLVDDKIELPKKADISETTTLGIDVGLTDFVITSNGIKKNNHRFLKTSLSKLNAAQRQLSRKHKGSANRIKQRKIVACIHDKVARQRKHYHHEVANELLNDNQVKTVAFEDLHVKGMIKNRKLSRSISDVAWSQFISIVEYKAEWTGKNIITCNRFAPSSKRCSCGYINKEMTLKDRVWTCPECLSTNDRDILAANNIKMFAIADALGQSVCVKQFPHDKRFSKSVMSKGQSSETLSGRKKPPLESSAAI
jgi:putative transposase